MTSNKALISIIPEGIPVLENSLGIRWQPSYMDGRYGLGTFCLNGTPLGGSWCSYLDMSADGVY